ncbi:hypothetical protein PENTCL1PPCAC_9886 [Pristionchus entomophagus]|uniref:Endonuclease/exonuclease/phosphatase domain-containing protein n=1 Tax=Pristionchus entomophagus TaxID=358040 RepID=A0AAV5T7Q2_9BILA|nr:hypothetical protein PENTCL1PPCAC_9886 [Pristionchus entomophagus]
MAAAAEEFINHLEFERFQRFRAAEKPGDQVSNGTGNTSTHADDHPEQMSMLFDNFKRFTVSEAKRIQSDGKGKSPTFNKALAIMKISKDEIVARRNGDKRRFILWNVGTIHDDKGHIKNVVQTLIRHIQPDGILLNELCLQYKYDSENAKKNLKQKFTNQVNELGYNLTCDTRSYKPNAHWVRGSAILIHKDVKGFKRKEQIGGGTIVNGQTNDYEFASVQYEPLDLPIYCCYIPIDNTKKKHRSAATYFQGKNGIMAGDLNMYSSEFKTIFSNMEDCMDDSWLTHQSGALFHMPKKIDYVVKLNGKAKKRDTNVIVIVHKPLIPDDRYVESHYPIIFDVFKGDLPEVKQCDDVNCELGCGTRESRICSVVLETRANAEERDKKKKLQAERNEKAKMAKKAEKDENKRKEAEKKEQETQAKKRAKEEKKEAERMEREEKRKAEADAKLERKPARPKGSTSKS